MKKVKMAMFKKMQQATIAAKLLISFSLVIVMYLGVAVSYNFVISRTDYLYRYTINTVGMRSELLLEFHQEFTELRRLLKASYYNEHWIEEADLATRRIFEADISRSYARMHYFANHYITLVYSDTHNFGNEALYVGIKAQAMYDILEFVDVVYNLFTTNFFIGGNDSHYKGNVLDYTHLVEDSLHYLRQLDSEARAEILANIDSTITVTRTITIIVLIASTILSVGIAYWTIRSFTGRLKRIGETVEFVKKGNFSVGLDKADDEMSQVIYGMMDVFRDIIAEINQVSAENDKGSVGTLMNEDKFEGDYKEAAKAVNLLINNMTENNDRVKFIFRSIPLVLTLWDANCNIIDSNQEALRLFGLNDIEEYSMRFFELMPEFQPDGTRSKAGFLEILLTARGQGLGSEKTKFEWLHQNLDKEAIPTEVSLFTAEYKGQPVIMTCVSDLRAVKEMMGERERIAMAESNSQAKSRFLARMSHEIRTPISAVLGISEVQLQKPDLPAEIEDAFNKIHNASDVLVGVLNDILDLSKIEAGKMTLLNEKYEIASLIHDVVQMHIVYLDNKKFRFEVEVDEKLPSVLVGDALRIKQVLNNIISNAFKYTEHGLVKFSVKCEALNESHISLITTVSDTGSGMTEAQRITLLSEEYTRFHEGNNPSAVGTGLGMPIVRSLIELMGAEMQVESKVFVGTTIIIKIPQEVFAQEIIGSDIANELEHFKLSTKKLRFTPEPMPYGKVLVVDDLQANLYVVEGLLKLYELEVETCDRAMEAIGKIKNGSSYDIIFMDHTMPEMDGTEATKILRSIGYNKPIVALTANALVGQAEEFLRQGFDEFIAKPIKTALLHEVLIKYIKDETDSDSDLDFEPEPTNQEAFDEYYSNSPDIQKAIREEFISNHKSLMADILTAMQAKDMSEAKRLAHNSKSLAQLLQENGLAEAAQTVELCILNNGTPSEAMLLEMARRVEEVLTRLLKEEKA